MNINGLHSFKVSIGMIAFTRAMIADVIFAQY